MRDRIGKWKYAPRNGAEFADFRAIPAFEICPQKSKEMKAFETVLSGRNRLAACERTSPKSSGLEQRYLAFHASLNTTNRQRSI